MGDVALGTTMTIPADVLGMSADHIGALLVGVGALLLLVDAVGGPSGISGTTFGGTQPNPVRRLSSGAELAGALLVATGSGLLLFASGGIDARAVLATLALAGLLTYAVMTFRLREHMNLVAREEGSARVSWWWCLTNPLWRPPPQD